MKKKILSVALIASLVLSAAGCGETESTATTNGDTTIGDNNKTAETTEENADVNEETVVETTEKETAIEEIKVGKEKLVPDCPVTHTDLDLGQVYNEDKPAMNINKWKTLADAYGDYELSSEPAPHVNNDVDFFFESINFGGVHFELTRGEEIIVQEYDASGFGYRYKTTDFSDCAVKGIAFYNKEGENKGTYNFHGVALSMSRDEVEAILGEGHEGTNQEYPTVMYNDGNVTMVIEYYPVNDEREKVQTIYLIRNN